MLIRSFGGAAARLVFAAFAIFAFSAAAQAQFLTFVAATGVDTRPCTVQAQPCRTVQRGITALSAGGTLRILTDLPQQQAATIAKSVTVEGGGHTMIGRLVINSASAVVALRGLNRTGRGAHAVGINILSAAAVHIEDCTVERYAGDAIKMVASTATKLFVSDTVARDNTSSGLYVDDANARVTVEDSRFDNNTSYGFYLVAARATVTRSAASGNQTGMALQGGPANVTETTAADNALHGFAFYGGAVATLASSVARGDHFGLFIAAGAVVLLTDTVIRSNNVAIYNLGELDTRQNNTVLGGLVGNAAYPFSGF